MEEETNDFNLSQIMQICTPCPNTCQQLVFRLRNDWKSRGGNT
jgi:hypothetical protein